MRGHLSLISCVMVLARVMVDEGVGHTAFSARSAQRTKSRRPEGAPGKSRAPGCIRAYLGFVPGVKIFSLFVKKCELLCFGVKILNFVSFGVKKSGVS